MRDLRRARRGGGNGRSHAGAPRRDAHGGARDSRGFRSGAGRRRAGQRSVPGRNASSGHHGRGGNLHARLPASVVLRGESRPSRGRGRHESGIDAAGYRNLSGRLADSSSADPTGRQDRSRVARSDSGERPHAGGTRRRFNGAADVDPPRRPAPSRADVAVWRGGGAIEHARVAELQRAYVARGVTQTAARDVPI